MLCELCAQRLSHDIISHLLPFRTKWPSPVAADPCRGRRRGRQADFLFVPRARKLLGLKVMLACRPDFPVQNNGEGREIREFAKRTINVVELDSMSHRSRPLHAHQLRLVLNWFQVSRVTLARAARPTHTQDRSSSWQSHSEHGQVRIALSPPPTLGTSRRATPQDRRGRSPRSPANIYGLAWVSMRD